MPGTRIGQTPIIFSFTNKNLVHKGRHSSIEIFESVSIRNSNGTLAYLRRLGKTLKEKGASLLVSLTKSFRSRINNIRVYLRRREKISLIRGMRVRIEQPSVMVSTPLSSPLSGQCSHMQMSTQASCFSQLLTV